MMMRLGQDGENPQEIFTRTDNRLCIGEVGLLVLLIRHAAFDSLAPYEVRLARAHQGMNKLHLVCAPRGSLDEPIPTTVIAILCAFLLGGRLCSSCVSMRSVIGIRTSPPLTYRLVG